MRAWLIAALAVLGLQAPLSAQARAGIEGPDLHLQVLGTSDLHGQFRARDTYSLKPANLGWAKLATLIRARKAAQPTTVLVDCGDTLQGEPVNYVRRRLRPDLPEPSIAVMNALGYHAMVVGNHEFDFGPELLAQAGKQATFPLLGANISHRADGRPAFPTHTRVTVSGVTVVVIGLTTPETPKVLLPEELGPLQFQDLVAAAKGLVAQAREREKADVVVVALHAGLGALPGQDGDANAALRLAETVPGIDAILTGHTHQLIERDHKGVPILQPGVRGQALAVVDLTLRKEKGRWRVVGRKGHLAKPTDDTPEDPEVLALAGPALAEADRYLDTPCATLQVDLDARMAKAEDTPLAQLLHGAMRAGSGAQITAVPVNSGRIFIPRGPTSVRQFYALMPYENRVVRIRITGAQLRAYLEHAARGFNFAHLPELFNREVAPFNHDVVDGCAYAIDLTRPAGQRIQRLTFQGQPVRDDQTFTLGITSYRAAGGGGYVEAMGWTGTPELVTAQPFRNYILGEALARPTLAPEPANRWRTIPYLDRDRVFQQVR